MNFQHRQMKPMDVRKCVDIIDSHPVIGPRYGSGIEQLQSAWLRLLPWEGLLARVFERVENSRTTICFVGVSTFVTDDFVRELKAAPFWFGAELTRRIARGAPPILTDKELREANARGGLNLLVWEGCAHPDFNNDAELPRFMMDVFLEIHQGYRLKEMIANQLENTQRLEFVLNSGALLWDAENGRYGGSSQRNTSEIVNNPHLLGVTLDIERARRPWRPSWVGKLFDYHPPRCGFSRSEQRLLQLALAGESTNEELAGALGISLPTVKKLWVSIYRRMNDRVPEISSGAVPEDTDESTRGKEKKRRLLAFVRERPEELRPVAQKLLNREFPNKPPDSIPPRRKGRSV
jgi:hypothetical protein